MLRSDPHFGKNTVEKALVKRVFGIALLLICWHTKPLWDESTVTNDVLRIVKELLWVLEETAILEYSVVVC
jgi:hypothetical protein